MKINDLSLAIAIQNEAHCQMQHGDIQAEPHWNPLMGEIWECWMSLHSSVLYLSLYTRNPPYPPPRKKTLTDSGKGLGLEIDWKCQESPDYCNRVSGSFHLPISFQQEQLDFGVELGLMTGRCFLTNNLCELLSLLASLLVSVSKCFTGPYGPDQHSPKISSNACKW